MENNTDNTDVLTRSIVYEDHNKKHTDYERIIRKKCLKYIMSFKPYFMQTIQWAPISLDYKLIFPFNMAKRTYDISVLDNENINNSEHWSKHIKKIKEYFEQQDQIKNINPVGIPSNTLFNTLIAFCICQAVSIIMYITSIIIFSSAKLNGSKFWAIFIPASIIVTFLACAVTYKVNFDKLREEVEDRAEEIYILTFYYNTNYFAEYDQYIHMGVYSSWIDIGPILDTDFVEADTLDSEIMQRNMTFDAALFDEINEGRIFNKNQEMICQKRQEMHDEACKCGKNDSRKKEMLMDSMAASYFFPIENEREIEVSEVVVSKGYCRTMTQELAIDHENFIATMMETRLKRNVLKMFKRKKQKRVKNEINRISGEGKPAKYSKDRAFDILASYINKTQQKKFMQTRNQEQNAANSQPKESKVKNAFGKYLSKMGVIKETAQEQSSCGISTINEARDTEVGIELNIGTDAKL